MVFLYVNPKISNCVCVCVYVWVTCLVCRFRSKEKVCYFFFLCIFIHCKKDGDSYEQPIIIIIPGDNCLSCSSAAAAVDDDVAMTAAVALAAVAYAVVADTAVIRPLRRCASNTLLLWLSPRCQRRAWARESRRKIEPFLGPIRTFPSKRRTIPRA